MFGWRKSKPEPKVHPFDEDYVGNTPAHEMGNCLRLGVTQFEQALIFPGLYVPEGPEKTYLDHLDDARRWWGRARWDDFGLIARWALIRELHPSLLLISGWTEYHSDDPGSEVVHAVWSGLHRLSDDLYTWRDHWLRLFSQGLISEERMFQEIARADPPKPDRVAVVAADLKRLRTAMAQVPQTRQ